MKIVLAYLLITIATLSYGQDNITPRLNEQPKPWSVQFEYSPLNFAISKSFVDEAPGSPRPANVSNKNTHQFGVAVFRNLNSYSFGMAACTYSFRQNLALTVPNDLIDGVTQYAETNQTFFRQKFAISGEARYNIKRVSLGLRIGVYSTFRQNNIEADGFLQKSTNNSELGQKTIIVEEKWYDSDTRFVGSISRISIEYKIIEQLRLGFNLTYNDFIKSQEKLYYKINVREDLDWKGSPSQPPVINDLRLFEPLWMAGFNIVYIPNF